MKIKHSSSLQAPDTNHPISRVELVSWSPNGSKIAACLAISNQIILFDAATNEKKDKFGLKSVDKNFSRKSFVVKGLCFSPDSTKIAIAQTDCVIYVYKIGENWEEKKSILARYPLPSPVTCTHWHNFGIVFGLADGKVKLIPNNANRMISLVSHNSMVTSISIAGDYIAAAYLNGAIFLASIGQRESTSFQVMNNTSAPFGLALSTTGYLCVCGTGGKIVFNQLAGQSSRNILNKQVVEYGAEVSGAYAFPSGHSIAIISLNKIIIFTLESSMWKQSQIIELTGTALLTCLTIAKDGTKLIVGTISGAIEVFECQWKKKLIDDRFEINYVGPNQVVIKDTKTSNSTVYRSDFEVKDVKIVREKFAIIWTTSTLILANTQDPEKMSEIEWSGLAHSSVKFSFDYENVVLIRGIGELFLVEFGKNHILASVRSDFFNPHLMSVQINLRKSGAKMLAYLLDMKTVAVIDLVSGIQICSWSNDEKIEWLEMNETGKRLLFKDKSSRLQCLDILTHENSVMLNYCQGVRWVPGSDVVVAQSRDKLYVWYDLMKPVIHDIVGDQRSEMIDIKRENGKTRVVFNGGGQDIVLDEMLIEFDTSLEDGDLRRAMSFLESCDFNVESESMWRTLAEVALKSSDIFVAERAFAAIGDVTKAHFIRQCFNDETKLALLENDWTMFESNNSIDDVVATYLSLHKWEKAIEVAIRVGRSDLRDDLERKYFEYLLDSGQHAEAGLLMEKKGNHEDAIRMYIKSGQFIQAAHLIFDLVTKQNFHLNQSVVEELIRELRNSQFMEEAGKLCQIPPISDTTRAFELFVEGKCYPKAIELARHEFPEEVVKLEEQYGDWLMAEGHDPSSAMVHFVEAGKIEKALEAAISANQYDKASELASILDHVPARLGKMIAEHYASIGRIDAAQDMYLSCGCIQDAITLLNDHNQYQRAYKLARKYMDSDAAREMYENMAQNMEKSGNLKEAERIYLTCSNIDAAIGMYKSHKKYDSMMKLVKQYHPDLVVDTNTHLAKELENSGQLHQAETHYIAASDWKSAVRMYKNNDNWEDAYRVARTYGGAVPAKQVAYMWAKSLPQIDDSVKLLARLGLLNQVVDYAVECNAYEFAKNLVTEAGPELRHKINDVNLKYAYWLENEERFDEAEALYLEANKPKEVVIMYMRIGDFSEALRVAEQYVKDENCVSDILVAQAKSVLEKEGKSIDVMMKAETLLLRAGRIELAVKMYKDFGMWDEALRVCEQYSPSLIDSVKRDMIVSSKMNGSGLGGGGSSTRGNSVVSMSDHFSIPDSRRASSRGSSFRHHNRRESVNSSIDSDDRRDVRSELEASKVAEDRTGIIRNALTLASQLIGEKSCQEAVKVVTANQVCLSVPEARIILIRLAADLMGFENEPQPMASTWKHLRNCFLQYLTANPASQDEQQIEKYLLISHYLYLREVLSSLADNHGGKKELLAKLSISLLRYTDIIRVDKFFFEAGKMAKETGRLDMAFILWNHFLDLIDAIEEGEVNVDHSDFVDTDIPSEVPLPSRPYSIESEPNLVEDVKSWILHMSMDARSTRSLPKDSHGYEASLMGKDGTQYLPCLVTGYPVSKQKMLELRPKKYAANKDDWNKLLMLTKVSSSEDLKDVLLFIGKLCGNATVTRFTFQ